VERRGKASGYVSPQVTFIVKAGEGKVQTGEVEVNRIREKKKYLPFLFKR